MRRQWRCYFCDEVFRSRKKAAIHFGVDACEADVPACKLMPSQEHMMAHVRGLERELSAHRDEATEIFAAMYSRADEMSRACVAAEEKGYAKGVADMMAQGYCSEPEKHK